ncbi:TadE/TadG family type IV pilus assembly protein [Aquibacillus sediminis]|uniref:TadE/TadG family type IV pilus assembly protein n=1 Tax=Aquibacillus sediminis TaxID=2574734 RepID=UPI001109686B|nr:TadE/TadG family type IV pilus assembly protein [Aquibacillus sediminis]
MIRKQEGQSLVEMALVIPVLLLLIVGIFDLGRTLFTYSALHFTAQETVRVGGLGYSDDEIIQFAKNHFQTGDPTKLEVTISPPQNMRTSGDYIQVALAYPIEPFIPIVKHTLPDQILLRTDSTVRVE